jgi:hypothetical protein
MLVFFRYEPVQPNGDAVYGSEVDPSSTPHTHQPGQYSLKNIYMHLMGVVLKRANYTQIQKFVFN